MRAEDSYVGFSVGVRAGIKFIYECVCGQGRAGDKCEYMKQCVRGWGGQGTEKEEQFFMESSDLESSMTAGSVCLLTPIWMDTPTLTYNPKKHLYHGYHDIFIYIFILPATTQQIPPDDQLCTNYYYHY